MISIHTASEGGDRRNRFQNVEFVISIHTASEGGDRTVRVLRMWALISIHTASEGGDFDKLVKVLEIEDFNPHRQRRR